MKYLLLFAFVTLTACGGGSDDEPSELGSDPITVPDIRCCGQIRPGTDSGQK